MHFVCSFTCESNATKCLGSIRARQRHFLASGQKIKEEILQSFENYYNVFCIAGSSVKMIIGFLQADFSRLHMVVTCEIHAMPHIHVRLALDSVCICLHFHPNILKTMGTPT